MLSELNRVIETATQAFENYDHARALETTETFFWTFCDDYLELVKERAYRDSAEAAYKASAVLALHAAVDVLLRLLAPFLPFATEEVWSWCHAESIHLAAWPTSVSSAFAQDVAPQLPQHENLLAIAGHALVGIRRAKTDAKVSQKTPVTSVTIQGPADVMAQVRLVAADLTGAGHIRSLHFVTGTVPLALNSGSDLGVTDIIFESDSPSEHRN